MAKEMLEIQPPELKFTFELKKQTSCSIELSNKSDQYVAFKVKTTSPKKYCVRPNTGIIKPRAACSFTVTMQAQRIAPPDMQCKDKFLIQGTYVPFGTTEEDITTDLFAKDSGKYIEEKKMKVVLVSAPPSPISPPINREMKQDPSLETSAQKDRLLGGVENIPLPHMVAEDLGGFESGKASDELRVVKDVESRRAKDVQELTPVKGVEDLKQAKDVEELKLAKRMEELKLAKNAEELKPAKKVEELKPAKKVEELTPVKYVEELKPAKDADELKPAKDTNDLKPAKEVEELKPAKEMKELRQAEAVEELKAENHIEQLELAKTFDELMSKHDEVDSKLREAELTIRKLTEERSMTTREKDKLTHELEVLRRKKVVRNVQVGFPFLYVCMVALISLAIGYFIHP